jgi:hypothetical protein
MDTHINTNKSQEHATQNIVPFNFGAVLCHEHYLHPRLPRSQSFRKTFIFFVDFRFEFDLELRKRTRKPKIKLSPSSTAAFVRALEEDERISLCASSLFQMFRKTNLKYTQKHTHNCVCVECVFCFSLSWFARTRTDYKKATWLILPVTYACLKD